MRALVLASLFGVAASCSLTQTSNPERGPRAILDAYLIAHGMAASTVRNPDVDPAVKQQLVILDARARAAVQALTGAQNGFADEEATARAVAELTEYAARQTMAAP